MKFRYISSLIFASVVLLAGCVAYPVTETYFEVNTDDGTPSSGGACYDVKQNSAVREVQGIKIGFAAERRELSSDAKADLEAWAGFSFSKTMAVVAIDPTKIRVSVEGASLAPVALSVRAHDHETRCPRDPSAKEEPRTWRNPLGAAGPRGRPQKRCFVGNYYFTLKYPPPSGLSDQIRFEFLTGAVQIDGRNVPVAPFRFSRVTKSGIRMHVINGC